MIDFPAVKENDDDPDDTRAIGDPLWPDKYNADRLAKIKTVLGEVSVGGALPATARAR